MMVRSWCWLAPVLVLGSLLCTGCDMASLLYFLVPEGKLAPQCPIADTDKKKEVKAMVLVLAEALEMRSETMQADRQLADLLVKQLREKYQANEDKVTLVTPRKVEEFKSAHPEWKRLNPLEIGRIFKVDYVIVLEMNSFSLVEKGGQMYQGRADIAISVVNVHQEDETPNQISFQCEYPAVANIEVSDMPPMQFRLKFLNTMAKQLSMYFASYSSAERRDSKTLSD